MARQKRPKAPSRAQRQRLAPKPSKAAEDQYATALKRVVKAWIKTVKRDVLPAAKAATKEGVKLDAKDPQKLSAAAKKLAAAKSVGKAIDKAASQIDDHTSKEVTKLGIALGHTPGLEKLVTKWRKSNVKLIKDFLAQESAKMEDILASSFGRRHESVSREIQERMEITMRRADLIARDQALTLNSQIAAEKQKAAGITEYIWTTLDDGRVRKSHRKLDGNRYSEDKPPPEGHPGEPVNCRCLRFPVIPALQ